MEAADGEVETTVEAGAGESVMGTGGGGEGIGAEVGDAQGELIIEIEGPLNLQQTLWPSWVSRLLSSCREDIIMDLEYVIIL